MTFPNIRKQLLPNDARGPRGIYSRGKAVRMPVNPQPPQPFKTAIERRLKRNRNAVQKRGPA